MSDDEILLLADHTTNKLCVRSVTDDDLIAFAKAVAAKERKACAELCESLRPSEQRFSIRFWDGCTLCAVTIRARGGND